MSNAAPAPNASRAWIWAAFASASCTCARTSVSEIRMSSAPSPTSVPRSTGVATTRPATSAETSACSSAVSVPVAATNREIGFSTTAAIVALTVLTSFDAAARASLLTPGRQPAAARARRITRVWKRIGRSSVSQTGPRGLGLQLNAREQIAAGNQTHQRKDREHAEIRGHAEMKDAGERASDTVNAVRQGINGRNRANQRRHVRQREERARQKERRHHEKIHDELEALKVFHRRGDCRAEGSEHHRHQRHEYERFGRGGKPTRTEARDETNRGHDHALNQRDRGPAERPANHDRQAGDRRHERFLQKSKLAVPDQFDTVEDRREKNGHADHARRQKLDVAALPCALKHRPEAKAQRNQEQQRLPKRSDDPRAGSSVPLQLAQPEHANHVDGHRRPLHIFAMLRIWSSGLPCSSRIVVPVSVRNASSRVLVEVRCFKAAADPSATILP